MSVKDFVQQRRDALIAMRRDFHMYPEPAWLEYRSAAKVADTLISLGYDVALGARTDVPTLYITDNDHVL